MKYNYATPRYAPYQTADPKLGKITQVEQVLKKLSADIQGLGDRVAQLEQGANIGDRVTQLEQRANDVETLQPLMESM
jgi:hypothetical protein